MRLLAKFIFYKLMGWTFNGSFPTVKKCVFIVVPHTSNWDFLMGLVIRKIMNIEINYVGKKSLFNWPYGWFFRWTGGAPIDRTKNSDTVSAVAQLFKEREVFRLALSPEGTRKRVYQWKTGFYYIAKGAKVPILLVGFDYSKRTIHFYPLFTPTDDIKKDYKTMKSYFVGIKGKNPENGILNL